MLSQQKFDVSQGLLNMRIGCVNPSCLELNFTRTSQADRTILELQIPRV